MSAIRPDNRLLGRIAVITGASSGLGRAIALKYAAAGARVVCADLKPTSRPLTSDKIPPQPTHELISATHKADSAIFVKADVTQESEIEALVNAAVKWGGRLDIMVNNAGITKENIGASSQRIHETPTPDFDLTHSINNRAVWLGCKHSIRQMLAQEPQPENLRGDRTRGWIINTASMLGLVGIEGASAYVASKFGAVGITKQVAIDYAKDRIHVNALCPGFSKSALIDTVISDNSAEKALADRHPWGRLGTPEDIADAALFLASDEAAWVTGHTLVVDGGYTCQ